eukprot:CAMPEP_0184682584 /NCGR_PEP_ID=MMETSP0312-20130426/7859_1 /TAXON_ID=31354 /ORGANISM="Compsopogon coeruleus, Strain SAG 36.94" /LENGTH=251 /DNA_ID=CAMNT_0027134347 /DNA_START=36 /DNA_END=791 /DNA_ORIENTATION=-
MTETWRAPRFAFLASHDLSTMLCTGNCVKTSAEARHRSSHGRRYVVCSMRDTKDNSIRERCHRETPSPAAVVAVGIAMVSLTMFPRPTDAAILHFRGERPTTLGVTANRYLGLCPNVQNCVSTSNNAYSSQFIPPWTYNPAEGAGGRPEKGMGEAIEDLRKVLSSYQGCTIIAQQNLVNEFGKGYYIYAEFESPLMGYVDDVEFLFQPDGKTVDYRSASRLGKDDLNANRQRIKNLRKELENFGWKSVGFN